MPVLGGETFWYTHHRSIPPYVIRGADVEMRRYRILAGESTGHVRACEVVIGQWKQLSHHPPGERERGTSHFSADTYTCCVSSAHTLSLTGGLSLTAKSFCFAQQQQQQQSWVAPDKLHSGFQRHGSGQRKKAAADCGGCRGKEGREILLRSHERHRKHK